MEKISYIYINCFLRIQKFFLYIFLILFLLKKRKEKTEKSKFSGYLIKTSPPEESWNRVGRGKIYNCVERWWPVKTVGVDSHQKGGNTITGRLNYPRGDASRFDRMGLKRGSLMANHLFTGRAVVEVVRLRNRSHGVTSNVIFHEVYEAAISILGNVYTWRHRFQRRASNRVGNSPLSFDASLPSFANCRLLKTAVLVTMLPRRGTEFWPSILLEWSSSQDSLRFPPCSSFFSCSSVVFNSNKLNADR